MHGTGIKRHTLTDGIGEEVQKYAHMCMLSWSSTMPANTMVEG